LTANIPFIGGKNKGPFHFNAKVTKQGNKGLPSNTLLDMYFNRDVLL
jgi:hypothetical protein